MNYDKNDGLNSEYGKLADKLFGKKKPSSKLTVAEEAVANDRRIENAVMYMLTEGYTITLDTGASTLLTGQGGDPEVAREALQKRSDYNEEITRLFKQFKNIIRMGDMTIEELESKIFTEFGVVSEQFRRQANPLEFDDEIKYMSEEEYQLMRESYNGEETTKG